MKRHASFFELFERRIQQDTNGCWLWTGYRNRGGYGELKHRGKRVLAHRLSWRLAHGNLPASLHVLHRCDNPACVRPEHLFLGTNQDNVADRIAKGRPGGRPPMDSDREPLFGRRKKKPRTAKSMKFGDSVLYKGKPGWLFLSRFNNIPPVNSRRFCMIMNTKTAELLSARFNELEPASRRRRRART